MSPQAVVMGLAVLSTESVEILHPYTEKTKNCAQDKQVSCYKLLV